MIRRLVVVALSLGVLVNAASISAAELGEPRDFWVEDLGASQGAATHIEIPTTLQGVGDHIYLYVADNSWGPALFHEQQRDYVMGQFETDTLLGDGVGAYERSVALFGEPSDIDANGHLIIVAYAFSESVHPEFSARFETSDIAEDYMPECVNLADTACSNEGEIIFVDVAFAGSSILLSKMLYELQRVIHFRADAREGVWLEAIMGGLAGAANGHGDGPAMNGYLENHGDSFVVESEVDKGAAMLFGYYLYERFDEAFTRDLVADTDTGLASVETAIDQAEGGLTFATVFGDWVGRILTAMPAFGGEVLGNLPLEAHDPDLAFPVPTADEPLATETVNIGATSWVWLGGTLSVPHAENLIVRIEADSPLEIRAFTLHGAGDMSTANPLPVKADGSVILEGNTLWQRIVLTVVNPSDTAVEATIEVEFTPEDVEQPEPVVEESDTATHGPDVVSEDIATGAPDVGEEPKSSGGGSCSTTGKAGGGASFLMLALLGLLAVARRRQGRCSG